MSARISLSSTLLLLLLLLLLFVFGPALAADVIRVPADVPTPQAAVNSASDGDVILISSGDYSSLFISNMVDLTIRAKGKVRLGVAPLGAEGESAALTIQNSCGIEVRGLRFENVAANAVFVANCEEVTLSRLRINGTAAAGILVQGSGELVIERTRITDAGTVGLRTESTLGMVIDRLRIDSPGGAGVELADGTDDAEISRVRVKFPQTVGFSVSGSDNVIEKLVVIDSAGRGIEVDPDGTGSGNDFIKSRVLRAQGDGVVFGGSSNSLFKCAVVKPGSDGVELRGTGSHRIEQTKIRRAGFDGVFMTNLANDNELINNRIVRAADDAIDMRTTGNYCEGNRLSKSDDNGLLVLESGNVFFKNRMKANGDLDIRDEAGGNTYEDNVFKTSNLP